MLIRNLCVRLFRVACKRDECRHSRRTYPSGNNIFLQATCKPLNSLQTEGFTDAISAQWYTSGTHFQQQEYSRQIDKRAHVEKERQKEKDKTRSTKGRRLFYGTSLESQWTISGRHSTESIKRFSITIAVTTSTEKAISRDN